MHGRRNFWSVVPSFLLVLGALFVCPPPARAQAPVPWSGIAGMPASLQANYFK